MSDYLRLLPSGLCVASGEDTFLTQLMNDNIRRFENQLPCSCRIKVRGYYEPGSPLGLVSTTPPTAGKDGPFLGILTHTPDRFTQTGVLQVSGLARVPMACGVNDFLIMENAKLKVANIKDIGSENYVGNVVALADNPDGLSIAYVLLRSWCGELGHAYRDGYVPCSGLGAEPRQQGKQKFIGGTAHVKGKNIRGVPFVNPVGVISATGETTFTIKSGVTNCFAQSADANIKVTIANGRMVLSKRVQNNEEIDTDIYMFVTVVQ